MVYDDDAGKPGFHDISPEDRAQIDQNTVLPDDETWRLILKLVREDSSRNEHRIREHLRRRYGCEVPLATVRRVLAEIASGYRSQ